LSGLQRIAESDSDDENDLDDGEDGEGGDVSADPALGSNSAEAGDA
jgi:DNA gyrase subunit A